MERLIPQTDPSAAPTVLVGVTGCIAAYKACELVRALQKRGYRVKVVMTENATRFVGATTFKALTREPVAVSLFDTSAAIHHISLAEEADVFVVAPATANVIAKIAQGGADDLLTTTALATRAPLIVAPAMNVHMWDAEPTRENIATLESRGVTIVAPGTGMLACGYEGAGRLAEVSAIEEAVVASVERAGSLRGKQVLVTAGPTHEPIDPVRYIANRSSGKMGYAIAAEALRRGAEVTLVSGPTSLTPPFGVRFVSVQTASEMLRAATEAFGTTDVAVFSAAVADWRVAEVATDKMKKGDGCAPVLEFVANPDILATLAAEKGERYVVGFAAETSDVTENARAKLVSKNADLIVGNDVSDPSIGFGTDHNRVWLVDGSDISELPPGPKVGIASLLWDRIVEDLDRRER